MDKKKPVFEIHLENWSSGLHLFDRGHTSSVDFIISELDRFSVIPVIYVLEKDRKLYEDKIHIRCVIKSHGVNHDYDEKADRSPYWNQEGLPLPPSGGFFFRLLPVCYLKWAIRKSGVFWIHPHDLDTEHPKLKNPLMNWKRHVGIKGSHWKLTRLIWEIDWHDPRT